MVNAWDPNAPGVTPEKEAERHDINEMRARTISTLRRELGARFIGGFVRSEYSMWTYPGLLLPDDSVSMKRNYISLLREFPICIATTGLHGSIGWKLAEYVAFSKAIVSEKLRFTVPHGFVAGSNYLEFESTEECLDRVRALLANDTLRRGIMMRNWEYYNTFLAPELLVAETLWPSPIV